MCVHALESSHPFTPAAYTAVLSRDGCWNSHRCVLMRRTLRPQMDIAPFKLGPA